MAVSGVLTHHIENDIICWIQIRGLQLVRMLMFIRRWLLIKQELELRFVFVLRLGSSSQTTRSRGIGSDQMPLGVNEHVCVCKLKRSRTVINSPVHTLPFSFDLISPSVMSNSRKMSLILHKYYTHCMIPLFPFSSCSGRVLCVLFCFRLLHS